MNKRQRKRQPKNHLSRYARAMSGVTEEWLSMDDLAKELEKDENGLSKEEIQALIDSVNAQLRGE